MSQTVAPRFNRKQLAWIPALCAMAVIAVESTGGLGAAHTKTLLLQILNLFYVQPDTTLFEEIHHLLRKAGHGIGYGLLGLLFARAWSTQIDRRVDPARIFRWSALRLKGCVLGVGSAFLIACADELHQSFTPGRTALFSDVLLDTAGAFALNVVVLGTLTLNRPQGKLWLASVRQRFRGTYLWSPLPDNLRSNRTR